MNVISQNLDWTDLQTLVLKGVDAPFSSSLEHHCLEMVRHDARLGVPDPVCILHDAATDHIHQTISLTTQVDNEANSSGPTLN